MTELRTAELCRYILPMREGGSLPALAEADDGFKYVVKFRGGGHGSKAVISELLGGEIARRAGLKVPELVFLNMSEDFGRTEPDEEVQDLLRASTGTNLGLHFLNGAMSWDVSVNHTDALTASKIVWLDSFITNVDRTAKNTNMLLWNHELWLIDHGSSFYFHHDPERAEAAAISPFPYIKDHALLREASMLKQAEEQLKPLFTAEFIDGLISAIPEEWLIQASDTTSPEEQRKMYRTFIKTRLENSSIFTDHAINARANIII